MTKLRPWSWGQARKWDRLAALVVLLCGAFITWEGMRYSFGSLARIGPGFIPVMVGLGIAFLALLVFLRGKGEDVQPNAPVLRPLLWVSAAIMIFTVLLERFGIVPTAIAMSILAIFADPRTGIKTALLVLALVVVLAVSIFHFGFRIPIPVLRWGL